MDGKIHQLSDTVRQLIAEREKARKNKDFVRSDAIRKQLAEMNYIVSDTPDSSSVIPVSQKPNRPKLSIGKIAVFGSGELSPTGRRIHEELIKDIEPPVKIALVETPAGFEDNPHHWYIKLEQMLQVGLKNYKPEIIRIPAIRNDGIESTNNPDIVAPMLHAEYIHTGAGSPTYAVKHLENSLALAHMKKRLLEGYPLSIASAATFAFSRYVMPVYEMYFAGADPYWENGLDFFGAWGLNLTFVPHWNNAEGGKEIDIRFGYMGEKRFSKLLTLLPGPTTLMGIDEHTACIFDIEHETVKVLGKGTITILQSTVKQLFHSGETFHFSSLRIS